MVNKRGERTTANLKMLEFVARKLGRLNDEVVYLGGCTVGLLITDSLLFDVRPTIDVDCIINIVSMSEYYQFAEKLKNQGFKEAANESVICRWYYDDVILDVMPNDEKILGFSNIWYKDAIKTATVHQLADDLIVRSVSAPYFIATKMVAFNARGDRDFLASPDLEDIVNVISGRKELVQEVNLENEKVKNYLKSFFKKLLQDDEFMASLPTHINEGPVTDERLKVVIDRMKKIADL